MSLQPSTQGADSLQAFARGWLAAATLPLIRFELESIFKRCAEAVTLRGPACWASGRCCSFESTGHLLYVTGLEAAYTIANLPPDVPFPTSLPAQPTSTSALTILAPQAAAGVDGRCPFQVRNLCGVHTIRPIGCRVYFCDRSAQVWQQDLYETLLRDLRALHTRHDIEYRYGEWRAMLAAFAGASAEARS